MADPLQAVVMHAARIMAAVIATVALALLAAACGGSSSSSGPPNSTSAGTSTHSQLLAFTRCVRSHGVPDFPDPQAGASNAKFPSAQQLRIGSSQLNAAETGCQHLLPAGIDDRFRPAEVPHLLSGMVNFSRCMRHHGVQNWPDPTVGSGGRPGFDLVGITGLDASSPQTMTKIHECSHLLPRALGGIRVRQP